MNKEKIQIHLFPKPECLPTWASTDNYSAFQRKIQVGTGYKQVQLEFYMQHQSDRRHVNLLDSVCGPYCWETLCKFLNEKLRRGFKKKLSDNPVCTVLGLAGVASDFPILFF